MFAHAWFQHRQVFWNVEANEGLYIFFKTVCDVYNLILEDNYTVPPEAEGISTEDRQTNEEKGPHPDVSASIRHSSIVEMGKEEFDDPTDESVETTTTISTGTTTRRHKHTPSTGSSVTTILEGEEEEPKGDSDSLLSPIPQQPVRQLASEPSRLATSLPFRFAPGEVEEKSEGDNLSGPAYEELHEQKDEDTAEEVSEKTDTQVPEDKEEAKRDLPETAQAETVDKESIEGKEKADVGANE